MAHIFECAVFQHNIFQGDCGVAPPKPGGGNLGLEGFIRRRWRRHKLACEWEALKAAQDAARKLRAQKYRKKREAIEAANRAAAKALHDAELCGIQESNELAALERALRAAANAKKTADFINLAQAIEHKAEAFELWLINVEEEMLYEEEESITALFI